MNATVRFQPGLHGSPSVGFEEPFEMLHACHERVQRMLRLLERLAAHLASHSADDQAAGAARDVLRYFDVAGPAHHEDEERHVLPWLAMHGQRELADRLHADHAEMTRRWHAVRTDLQCVAAGRMPAPLPEAVARWQAYAALYAGHIAAEEELAYPPVRAAGDAEALRAMGLEMAGRRGVNLDPAHVANDGGS